VTFKPGYSGNPTGQRKSKIWPFTAKDIETKFEEWKELIETGEFAPKDRERALARLVEFMADRMHGKPAQAVDITSGDKPLAAIVNITLSDLTKVKPKG
jgi:hypothetical protein